MIFENEGEYDISLSPGFSHFRRHTILPSHNRSDIDKGETALALEYGIKENLAAVGREAWVKIAASLAHIAGAVINLQKINKFIGLSVVKIKMLHAHKQKCDQSFFTWKYGQYSVCTEGKRPSLIPLTMLWRNFARGATIRGK